MYGLQECPVRLSPSNLLIYSPNGPGSWHISLLGSGVVHMVRPSSEGAKWLWSLSLVLGSCAYLEGIPQDSQAPFTCDQYLQLGLSLFGRLVTLLGGGNHPPTFHNDCFYLFIQPAFSRALVELPFRRERERWQASG